MANPQNVIADAAEKLKRSISNEDAHHFASTELKDVWSAVKDIDSKQRKRQSAQNLRRIEPLLRGIEKYTKVIEVLCNGTPYMPYIWAPIKLMLEIASHHRDVFEALLSAYADIGAALPRFDRYKTAFNDNLEFQHALAAVYSGILDFHQRAYKFFRRRAWHVIFLSLWKDFGSRFDSIIDFLKKQRDFLDIEAASFDIIEAKESRIKLQDEIQRNQKCGKEMVEESERNARNSQLQLSITWLSTDEKIQETVYERTSRRRHDKTCEWLSNELRWKNWIKDDSKSPCLWLDGKPGSGKSVMCSYIVQMLADTHDLTTCYYFCNSQDTGNICQQILTILILQIVRQHPEVCTLIANEYVYRGPTCGMAQLRSLVPQLLEIVGHTRIVVDGIDECSKENQKAILKELQAVCTGSKSHCKVLFSSRQEVHIREKLSSQPQISLDRRQEVDFDIRSFVRYKVTKLRTSDQDLLDKIETILVEKADGMFLWVRLVVDELKHCYCDAAIEKAVTTLPKGLKAAYGRILDRIMDPNSSGNARFMAIRILGWMACSYRTLKIYELLDGIAFNSSNTTLTAKTKIRKDILDLCRPLIEDGPSGTVDFVHFSAKEFILEEEFQGGRPFIWHENAHLDIAFSCVAVLNSCILLLPTSSTDAERAAFIVQGFHGLQIYADKFWYKHLLEYCGAVVQEQRQFSPELLVQLHLLVRFNKPNSRAIQTLKTQAGEDMIGETGLEALSHVPDVQIMLSDVIRFGARMNREEASDKSPEKTSLDWCDMDPTHLSTLRYHYRKMSESLLDNSALETFPQINQKDLKSFQNTYGASAFLCRYVHCIYNTDGFDSSAQRAKHESQHQRRFRCAHSSCFSFKAGFVTRSQLSKHNERYHPNVVDGPSLAECLAPIPPTTRPGISTFRATKKAAKAAEIPELVAPEEPELSPKEKRNRQEKEILFLRHRLQKGLLIRDQEPKEEEMKSMSEFVGKLEGYTDLEVDIIRATKINKVLKAILKIPSIPKEEEFNFKARSQSLLDKWNKLLASEQSEATNGTKESSAETPEVVASESPELSPQEKLNKKEKEILFLRHKLQKGLLVRDQDPKEEEMKSMSEFVSKLEGHTDLEVDIIRATKINKVLKAILKTPSIPKEEEFNFKARSRSLLDKWNKLLASEQSEPDATTAATSRTTIQAKAVSEDAQPSPTVVQMAKESSADEKPWPGRTPAAVDMRWAMDELPPAGGKQ